MQTYTPTHLKLWTRPPHYFGEEWHDWYPVMGRNRDSDLLTESNFFTALDRLQQVASEEGTDEGESTVRVVRESHFLCGWVEWIAVHKCDRRAVEAADDLIDYLTNRHGCLNEEDYSRRESERAAEVWESFSLSDRIRACQEGRVSIFAARRDEVPEDPTGALTCYLTK